MRESLTSREDGRSLRLRVWRGRLVSSLLGLSLALSLPATAGPVDPVRRAASLEQELTRRPEKLKQRRNVEPVIRAWQDAAKSAKGDAKVAALEGLARTLETLAHWSGRADDKEEARKARARAADLKREAAKRSPPKRNEVQKVASRVEPSEVKTPAKEMFTLEQFEVETIGPAVIVALDVPEAAATRTEEIPASGNKKGRYVVDFSPVVANRSTLKSVEVGHAGIASVRIGQLDGDTVRVVLDYSGDRPKLIDFERAPKARIVISSGETVEVPVAPVEPETQETQGASPTPDIPMDGVNPATPDPTPSTMRVRDEVPSTRGSQAAAPAKRDPATDRSDVLVRKEKEEAAKGLDALVRELTATGNKAEAEKAPVAKTPVSVEGASTSEEARYQAALPPIDKSGLSKKTREALRPRSEDVVRVRRVVVDAGHGGKDTGAISKRGVYEKDINLAIAQELGQELQRRGIEVVYTRSDDTFVSLPERTSIAGRSGADLFVSVHSNANRNRRIQGIETYYLNTTSNRYAARLAQRENAAVEDSAAEVDVDPEAEESPEAAALPPGAMGQDIRMLLADLAMRSATSESQRLAGAVQGSIVGNLKQKGHRAIDLGVKSALFYVLLGVRTPSILIESGFLTNPDEESRLTDPKYRKELAKAIADGVYRYAREREQLARAEP